MIALSLALWMAGCSHEHTKTDAPAAPPAAPKADDKAKADAKPAADSGKLECTNKNETRQIAVRTKDKGCEVAYTKGGKEQVISSAKNGTTYCQKSLDKLRDKLKSSGYTCK
jgi:hypothetical protein